ncbi:LuxR family transcriptional regulator [Pseudomonas sp. ODNR1LW]|nr:LuxR family transcriptional regulator [Pseudomonas sp. ODNR1LW]
MLESLSPREIECVRLAGLGLEDKEIAARLGISPRTVGNHLHRAYGKLGVSDRRLAARRLSNDYSGQTILISDPTQHMPSAVASAGQSDDDGSQVRTAWLLPAPPRGVGARLAVIIAGAAVALLLVLGIVTAGMVVPSLFDRIAPEATR